MSDKEKLNAKCNKVVELLEEIDQLKNQLANLKKLNNIVECSNDVCTNSESEQDIGENDSIL